jgi:maleylacetate reductase
MLDLPHAALHAALLPYTAAFVLPAAPGAARVIAAALGVADAAEGIAALARELGTPASLAELGVSEDDAGRAAAMAAPELPAQPRAASAAELEELLLRAVRGDRA